MVHPSLVPPGGHLNNQSTTPNVSRSAAQELQAPPLEKHEAGGEPSFASKVAASTTNRQAPGSGKALDSVSEHVTTSSPLPSSSLPADRESTPGPALRCTFVDHCNTGSDQLRKAISHFFGRNKSCTKLIPPEVWMYFCRKHYQRCRYRNAKHYGKNQIGYVVTQIEHIRDWDVGNRAKGSSTRIKHWQFSLRKREKNRLQQEVDDDELDPAAASDITPPPQWVLDVVDRSNYTSDDILRFALRLQQEIEGGSLGGIPEVEFLPMIEGADSDKAAAKKHRKQSRSSKYVRVTKRKAADSPEIQSSRPADINTGFASQTDVDAFELISPSEKRPRLDGPSGFANHQAFHLPSTVDSHQALPAPRFSTNPELQSFGAYDNTTPARAPNVVPMFQHGLGQTRARFSHGYSSTPPSQLTLPSISAQFGETLDSRPSFLQHAGQEASGMASGLRPSNHNQFRASHQRSASAFTPVNRPAAALARPSSSGNDAPAAPPRFNAPYYGRPAYEATPRSLYNSRQPAPQYVHGHGMSQQYGYDHGHQQANHGAQQHASYGVQHRSHHETQHQSNHGTPQPQGYNSALSQHPSPVHPQAYATPPYAAPRVPVASMTDTAENRTDSEAWPQGPAADQRYERSST